MEQKKQILSELNRMREIMGLKLIMEATVPPAVRQALLDFMGFTEKQVDALERSADDLSDFTKLSDEFATLGIKNLDDLQRHVAQEMGIKSIAEVSDEVILKYMKQTPEIMQGVTKKLNSLVADAADSIIKKADWEDMVGIQYAENFEFVLRQAIDAENASDVKYFAINYKNIVDDVIDETVANGGTVPDSLKQLSEELGEKIKQADNIDLNQNKDFSQTPGDKTLARQEAEDAARQAEDAAKEASELERLAKENEEILRKLEEVAKKNAMVDQAVKEIKSMPGFSNLTSKQQRLILDQIQTWADEGRSSEWIISSGRLKVNQALQDLQTDADFKRRNPALWKKAVQWMSDNKTTTIITIVSTGLLAGWWTWAEILGEAASTVGNKEDFEQGLKKKGEGTYENNPAGLQKWADDNGYKGALNNPVPSDFSLKLVQDGAGTDHTVKYNEDLETFELLN